MITSRFLRQNDIHLWLCDCDARVDDQLITYYRSLCSNIEKLREKSIVFAKDRKRYLTTRILVRWVLSQYFDRNPKDWSFKFGLYGRPDIDNSQADDHQLVFNVSHTQNMIVMAVSKGDPIGVDIEHISNRDDFAELANLYFSPEESTALSKLPTKDQATRFLEYWTLKEAYLKARGLGLHICMKEFLFKFDSNDGIISLSNGDQCECIKRCRFWQSFYEHRYIIALCAERTDESSLNVETRVCLPFVDFHSVGNNAVRVSV